MKHLFITILMICMGISSATHAQTFLTISKTTSSKTLTTHDNSFKLGTITYDQATKTVTLDNVYIIYSGTFLSINQPGVTVKVKGTNTIKATYFVELQTRSTDANFKLEGVTDDSKPALLRSLIDGRDDPATFLSANNSMCVNTITIKDCALDVFDYNEWSVITKDGVPYNTQSYIVCSKKDNVTNDVIFDNSTLRYIRKYNLHVHRDLVRNVSSLRMKGCFIERYPDITLKNGVLARSMDWIDSDESLLTIHLGSKYGISINGYDVNTINEKDILGDGKIKYIPESKRLDFNNAIISSNDKNVPALQIDKACDVYLDDTSLLMGETNVMVVNKNVTLHKMGGDGRVGIMATNGVGLVLNEADLTVDGAYLTTYGKDAAILGTGTNPSNLKFINSNIEFEGPVTNVSTMTLDGCLFSTPNVSYDQTKKALVQDGEIKTNTLLVSIVPGTAYGVYVNDQELTSLNNKYTGKKLTSGEIYYRESDNTLVLKDAKLDAYDVAALKFTKPMKVEINGINSIVHDGKDFCLDIGADLTFTNGTPDGRLDISQWNYHDAIRCRGVSVSLKNTYLDVTADRYVWGDYGAAQLNISGSTLYMTSNTRNSTYSSLNSFVMSDDERIYSRSGNPLTADGKLSDTVSWITIKKFGDYGDNGFNNTVTINEVKSLISKYYLLSSDNKVNTWNFMCDYDKNGKITMVDINALMNKVLNK